MASKLSTVALVATLVAVFMACASAQSGCTIAIIGLSPCLGYISGNTTTPSGNCCSQLASVVKSEPQCLCTVLDGGASQYGLTINQTQALALPGACSVKTPSVSQCNSVAGPTASPTAPSGSPTTPSTTEGSGSKATPGTTASAGSTAKTTFSLGFFLIVLVSCA